MKRRQEAAFQLLKKLDEEIGRIYRAARTEAHKKHQPDDYFDEAATIQADRLVAAFEKNTGFKPVELARLRKKSLRGRRPGRKYRLLYVADLH